MMLLCCLILWHKVVGSVKWKLYRHMEAQTLIETAAGEAAGLRDSQGDSLTIDVCLHVTRVCVCVRLKARVTSVPAV